MYGVPHRSLLRSVRASSFRGRETWLSRENVSDAAVDDFVDERDPETSLWTDEPDASRRTDVILALAFKRPSLGKFSIALLWQDDERIGLELGRRIVQSTGDTPFEAARPLHYHVTYPQAADYRDLAFASARRELVSLSGEQIRELVEEAFVARLIPGVGLADNLQKEIGDLLRRRFIDVVELQGNATLPIFDVRGPGIAARRIPRARVIREADLEAFFQRARIGARDAFVLYCQDGIESMRIARALRVTQKVPRVLVGGFDEWLRQGFAIEST